MKFIVKGKQAALPLFLCGYFSTQRNPQDLSEHCILIQKPKQLSYS